MKKVRIAVQTEASLLRLRTRQTFRALALIACASVFVLMAVTVLNEAAFGALRTSLGPIFAGLIVGGVDFLLAALLMRIALADPEETEEERLAQKVRDMTYESLGEDLDVVRAEVVGFLADIHRLRKTISDVTSGIVGTARMVTELAQFMKAASSVAESHRRESSKSDAPPSDA